MNLAKLQQRLTKECKRSPAKAGVLAILFPVALWFWAPLIQSWVSPSGRAPVAENSRNQQAENQKVNSRDFLAHVPWKTIAEELANDPLMLPGRLRTEEYDPFFPPEDWRPKSETVHQPPKVEEPPPVTPQSLGMQVTSVISGSRPMARINQQNYRLGATIHTSDARIRFQVTAIEAWGVRLSRGDQEYELLIDPDRAPR